MFHDKHCAICGAIFTTRSAGACYCSEACRKKSKRKQNRQYLAEEQKQYQPKATIQGRSKPKLSIAEVCRRAKAEGLTYGKYVERHGID